MASFELLIVALNDTNINIAAFFHRNNIPFAYLNFDTCLQLLVVAHGHRPQTSLLEQFSQVKLDPNPGQEHAGLRVMGMNAEDSRHGTQPASFESPGKAHIPEGTSMLEQYIPRVQIAAMTFPTSTAFSDVYGMRVSCVSCVLASFEESTASRAMDLL
ncbi:uncharacterized protein BO96DRAFT_422990 [Aspergillus niger CBS 101883]|uniref:uncharacterized protein n=1 Tax=Aspergillus lacticoffeatus (strain CBS 101883) TaxID=1450533 RepID=UPI000D7F40F1|nr:uncharacterized protein BO96DRAFT_422990 [Aspergillus niger CBS 101883]PYH56726.1 hypothetical protein BO96DRAFT_422990 [Aspergillus niger CBS 101883]